MPTRIPCPVPFPECGPDGCATCGGTGAYGPTERLPYEELLANYERLLAFVKVAAGHACQRGLCLVCGRGGFDYTGKDNRVATTFAGQCKYCAMADRFQLEVKS